MNIPPEQHPDYLGDGVYCCFDGYQIWLWTSNGYVDSERIALEPMVLDNLNRYAARIKAIYEKRTTESTGGDA
jgi:hypothetical protein